METQKWRVTTNFIGGSELYAVCRVKDPTQVVHSGNIEFATSYMASKEKAQEIADQLNSEVLKWHYSKYL